MKDLFEYKLSSLNFGLIKGWDTTFNGHKISIVIAEENKNLFFLWILNFDFLILFEYINNKNMFFINDTC